MPRRRQSADSRPVSFELVENLDDEHWAPDGPARSAGSDGRDGRDGRDAPSVRRGTRWTPWTAAAGVLALLAGGLTIGGQIEERRTTTRLVASEGGVLPFTGQPRELWTLDLSGHDWMPASGMLLSPDTAAETITAVDVLTGEKRWQTAVGPQPRCGRNSFGLTYAQDDGPLVCLSGPPDATKVSVLSQDGKVTGSRDLVTTEGGATYAVGPGATVVHVRRVGPVGPPVGPRELDDGQGEVDVPGGRDVVVTLEDALSGDVLWTNRVPFVAPDEIWNCLAHDGRSGLALDQAAAQVRGYVVTLSGCGVDAAFDVSGARLDQQDVTDDRVDPLTSEIVSRFDQWTMHTTVLDRTGSVLWDVAGLVLLPSVTDGTGDDTVFVDTLGGLTAFSPDGEELWQVPASGSTICVRTSTVVVVADGSSVLTALDPASGRTLWSTTGEDATYLSAAATDGSQVIVLNYDDHGTAQPAGYDLATGELLWVGASSANVGLVAYRGALLRFSEDSVSRVG